MNAATTQRLAEIYPELSRRVQLAISEAAKCCIAIEITQGVRTWPEQAALYAKGRTPFGTFIDQVHRKDVVTYAKAGESYHNYGLAVDFAVFENDVPDWNTKNPGYQTFIEISEKLGLVSGSRWPEPKTDFDHLQLTGKFDEAKPDVHCRYLYTEGGFRAVWAELDAVMGITR